VSGKPLYSELRVSNKMNDFNRKLTGQSRASVAVGL
jgi:hypothetical protein